MGAEVLVPIISSADKIAMLFTKMAAKQARFGLKVEPSTEFHIVRVTEFKAGSCILCASDQVDGLAGKAQGKVIVDGRPLLFATKLYKDDKEQLIRADIPDALCKPQNRNSFRIDVPAKYESKATFWGEGNLVFSGLVKDVSSGGCLVEIGLAEKDYTEHAPERATTCIIELDDNPPIEMVANPVSVRKAHKKDHTLVGFQFIHAGTENAALNQILSAVQRKILRDKAGG